MAHRDLGKDWSMILEIKEGHHLVTHGVYNKVRHLMYTHFWIRVIAQGIVLANVRVLVFGIVAWALIYFLLVPKEEEMLVDEFGDEYREYMKNNGGSSRSSDFLLSAKNLIRKPCDCSGDLLFTGSCGQIARNIYRHYAPLRAIRWRQWGGVFS